MSEITLHGHVIRLLSAPLDSVMIYTPQGTVRFYNADELAQQIAGTQREMERNQRWLEIMQAAQKLQAEEQQP